jgi:3'-phosphoadenosine 5'-phosphosulfate sulfotransferase (PAPS reductase)/FAD synthetase
MKMKPTEQILSETLQRYKPSLIVCSYSGGYDSMVATHKALQWAKQHAHSTNILTIAVNTKLHADGWPEFVTTSAKTIGSRRFEIWQSRRFDEWVQFVKDGGFGHTKIFHTHYFRMLKEAAFRDIVKRYKKYRNDRIMFVTGMRRSESRERVNTPEHSRVGSYVWCNPLVHWNEEETQTYRIEHDLPENPFYHHGLGSGDCQCNWHRGISLTELNIYCKGAAEIINPLDKQCREQFGYGYGEEPSKGAKQEAAGQLRMFDFDDNGVPNLCASCERPKATQDQVDSVLLQRMEW